MTDFLLKKRPNIVLIMCDQMRGDCLGIAGQGEICRAKIGAECHPD